MNCAMLDPDIRRLLETIFSLPPASAPPDVARLRAAAEAAPKVLGGPAEEVASIRDTRPRRGARVRCLCGSTGRRHLDRRR